MSKAGLEEKAARLGYSFDTSSAGAISDSFGAIDSPEARKVLELASHKAIHRARYFCAGMLDIAKYHHFALNIPLYTHFTSPIRRYAYVIVHRQLDSILPGSSEWAVLGQRFRLEHTNRCRGKGCYGS